VRSAASTPLAPARFSTTTCAFHASESFWPISRAITSVPPPGAKPTTSSIGRSGQAWAAVAINAASVNAAAFRMNCITVSLGSVCDGVIGAAGVN